MEELIAKKYKVKILDLNPPNFFHKNLKFIKGNILDYKKLDQVIKNSLYVYNFAGIADLDYVSQPIKSVEQNMLATVNMLNL